MEKALARTEKIMLMMEDESNFCDDPYEFEENVFMIREAIRRNIPFSLEQFVFVMTAATEYRERLCVPRIIATEVRMGVFVIDKYLFTRIVSEYADELACFQHVYGIDLVGTKCSCTMPCPMTRSFLGKLPCARLFEKMMLVRTMLPCRDTSSLIIREMMF